MLSAHQISKIKGREGDLTAAGQTYKAGSEHQWQGYIGWPALLVCEHYLWPVASVMVRLLPLVTSGLVLRLRH